MNHQKRDEVLTSPGDELIREGASVELRLLRAERKAEARLGKAVSAMEKDRVRLHKAKTRLERSRNGVRAAEATLRDAQLRRASGPDAMM
jgi:hypothetical protein